MVIGTALGLDGIFGLAALLGLQNFLQCRFVVSNAAAPQHLVTQTGSNGIDDLAHDKGTRRLDSGVEIERADHGFDAVGEEGILMAASAAFFSAAEEHVVAEFQPAGHRAQLAAADQFRAQPGQRAFIQFGIAPAQRFSNQQAHDGIAKELKLFVVGAGIRSVDHARRRGTACGFGRLRSGEALLIGQRTMREGACEQLGLCEAMPEQQFEFSDA